MAIEVDATYRGGTIHPDAPLNLPENTPVRVVVVPKPAPFPNDPGSLPEGAAVEVTVNGESEQTSETVELTALLLRHAGRGRDLPADLAEQHDHYVHGLPRT